MIQEIDYQTGAVLNTFPMPVTNSFSTPGWPFDGTFLWVLAGTPGNDSIYQMDPDTGAILDTHILTGNRDGMALRPLMASFTSLTTSLIIESQSITRCSGGLSTRWTLGAINDIDISGGLAAITGPDRLYVTSTFGSTMYEINPISGVVTNEWTHGLGFAQGVATANNQIYVGRSGGRDLRVFDRQGAFQRSVRLTSNGVYALGGDNVLTPVDTPYRFRDVYSGLDNKIYAVDVNGSIVGTYDASTLTNTGFITLAAPVNALAARQMERYGECSQRSAVPLQCNRDNSESGPDRLPVHSSILTSMSQGQILLTSSLGRVYRTDTAGATPTHSVLETLCLRKLWTSPDPSFRAVLVQLTNSDSTAIRLPTSVVIPVGQRS